MDRYRIRAVVNFCLTLPEKQDADKKNASQGGAQGKAKLEAIA